MYVMPRSIEDALAALAQTGGRIIAGGTDIMPALVDRPRPPAFVDLSRIAAMRAIAPEGGGLRIGACATWTDIIACEAPAWLDGLKAAAREIGGRQIQNAGTLAGNLCNASPAADGVPPLLALDASVELQSLAGRRTLPLAEFISGNRRTALRSGEIVTAILLPQQHAHARSAFLKLGARRYLVISIAMVAVLLVQDGTGRIEEARIAVGACSPVALRLTALERDLAGVACNAQAIATVINARHVECLTPIDDGRATALYRRDAALTLVRRALADCCGARRDA